MKGQKKGRLAGTLSRFCRKCVSKIPRLSRPWRIVRNLVCIAFGVYLIWLLMGGYPLTKEWAFRRAERRAMVGPSEILLEWRGDRGDTTILGETPEGYFLGRFARIRGGGWTTNDTLYIPRQADITMTVTDIGPGIPYAEYVGLLLCDDPAVERGVAEVTFTGGVSVNGRWFEVDETYTVEFLPEREGVLAGEIQAKTSSDESWEGEVERYVLSWIYSMATPVTIRLYDGAGALLLERSIQYRYPGF